MANLVKIGSLFLNLDQVLRVDDLFVRTREDRLVVYFSSGDEPLTLAGQEADDLRTWLNTVATNLRQAADPESRRPVIDAVSLGDRPARYRRRPSSSSRSSSDGRVSALSTLRICSSAWRFSSSVFEATQSAGTTRWKSRM